MSLIFGNMDLYIHGAKFLSVEDIVHLNKTCKGFWVASNSAKMDDVYRNACIHDGIPLVDRDETEKGSVLEDLKILYKITISGKKIGQIFGTLIGPVPTLPRESFNSLKNLDFFLVVEPSIIQRGKELIHWSETNIIRLCKNPLPQPPSSEPNTVYGLLQWEEDVVPNTSFSDRVTLHIIGKKLLEGGVLPQGMIQASNRIRLLVNSIEILSCETRDNISTVEQIDENGICTRFPLMCNRGVGVTVMGARSGTYILAGTIPELPIPDSRT